MQTTATEPFLNLNDYLLGFNPDNNLLVKIDEKSEDFNAGDLLVVNISLKPKVGDFVLVLEEETNSRYIERFESGNAFGVVTATIRSL